MEITLNLTHYEEDYENFENEFQEKTHETYIKIGML